MVKSESVLVLRAPRLRDTIVQGLFQGLLFFGGEEPVRRALGSDCSSSRGKDGRGFPGVCGQGLHTCNQSYTLHQHPGKGPPHCSPGPSGLPHTGRSSLHICSLCLRPNQGRHKQNRAHTLQPTGRNLASFLAPTSIPTGLAPALTPRPGPTPTPGLIMALSLLCFPPPWHALPPWLLAC